MDKLAVFGRIVKVDLGSRTVEGVAMDETPDRDGEIYDYNSSKPYVKAWANGFAEATKAAGQEISYGNIRAMHDNIAAGKVTDLNFDDQAKSVPITAKVLDDAEWEKVQHGVYTGFSVKGRLVGKKWRDGSNMRYTVDPIEISLVDLPCNPGAKFLAVKADGTSEEREFQTKRDFSEERRKHLAASGQALPDGSFPIENREDLHNAIEAVGRAKNYEAAKKHIMERARALDATDQLPAGWTQKFAVADLQKFLDDGAEILKRFNNEAVKETTMTPEEQLAAEIAKKADHLAKAVAAHEELGKCLDGSCGHKGIGKCAEKMASAHEKLGKSLERLGKDKDDDADDAEKAAKAAEVVKAAEALKAAEEDKKAEIEKAAKAEVDALKAKLVELEEKVSKSAVDRGKPIVNGHVVKKSDDNPNPEETKNFDAVKKDDPLMVEKSIRAIRSAEPVLVD